MRQERRGFVQDDDLEVAAVQRGAKVGHELQAVSQHPRRTNRPVEENGHIDVAIGPRSTCGD